MIRHVLKRPLLSTAALAAVVAASGAGYGAATSSAQPGVERAAFALDAAQVRALQQEATTEKAEEEFLSRAADVAQADRAAARAAQEAAAAEAEARVAAERQAAAEQASRAAARDPRSAARAMLADFGWSEGQFSCLDVLWERESNWDHTADNPSSSAYGIPQALPGSKMASAGEDWRTNPVTQIRWGLGYIADIYGSPCAALDHSDAHGWY